ncbi:A disintegrin and metalloproteinase with thrombospondin motifs adt-2-like [Ischnura elegans]|uniref:A disintegrin and metalloproteinase with thrombospondin motifs adt-2-like n=1 Tax=Ischnura elegans TaxID=197161 RepID=UPI001ED8707C|nr:A disintegrin and metalloproteinase with thrombospondin motifs adt-2-like [Ischnura elegans]
MTRGRRVSLLVSSRLPPLTSFLLSFILLLLLPYCSATPYSSYDDYSDARRQQQELRNAARFRMESDRASSWARLDSTLNLRPHLVPARSATTPGNTTDDSPLSDEVEEGQVTFPHLSWRSGGGASLEVKAFGRKFRMRLRRVPVVSGAAADAEGPVLYRGTGRGSMASLEVCGYALTGDIYTAAEDHHYSIRPLTAVSTRCEPQISSSSRASRRTESIPHLLTRLGGGILTEGSRRRTLNVSSAEPLWWRRGQSLAPSTAKDAGEECGPRSRGSRYQGCGGPQSALQPRTSSSSAHLSLAPLALATRRRAPAHLYVETAVFVDSDLYTYMEENFFPVDTEREVKRVVLAMINAVELLYQDPSLGRQLSFIIKRLEILRHDPPTLVRSHDIDRYLASFCTWQSKLNVTASQKWDHALLLTGLDLYVVGKNGKINDQVVGLAPVGGMCTGTNSCTLNEGRHFESVYVVAHEIGHNLGMIHDGPNAGNSCDPSSHIMSPTLGSGKITWSHCSRKFLERFLSTSQSSCLFDKPKAPTRHLDHNAGALLPGERFNADQQCMLKYGRGSGRAESPGEGVCRDLQCRRDRFTWASSHPALEGTDCGVTKWCRGGQCVDRNPPTIKGLNDIIVEEGWSPWTECASACLRPSPGRPHSGSTGISHSTQKCNGHRGKRGSQHCQGSRRRYRTCRANQCANVPAMSVLDYAIDVCSRGQEVDDSMTGSGSQRLSSNPVEACTVWCFQKNGGYKSRGWTFPDGTACLTKSYNRSAPSYCIDGACQEFIRNEGGDSIFDNNDVLKLNTNKLPKAQAVVVLDEGGGQLSSSLSTSSWGPWRAATSLTCAGSPLLPSPLPAQATTCGSSCRFACMAPGSGLRLVERECRGRGASCDGPHASIQLCIPENSECTRLKTPFEHASQVCSGYREKVRRLSGLGMQISPSIVDPDRPCRVACQDEKVRHRFYLVNGADGWFPFGTDCSRGVPGKRAFCVAGKCLDFGEDGVLLEHSEWQASVRGLWHRRVERSLLPSDIHINSSLDQKSLTAIIKRLDFQGSVNPSSATRPENHSSLDLTNPVHIHVSDALHIGSRNSNATNKKGYNGGKSCGLKLRLNFFIFSISLIFFQAPWYNYIFIT